MSTHVKISTITVGAGGAASIDFTSIPATYTDLVLKASVQSNRGTGDYIGLRMNTDTGNNYNMRYLMGDGAAASSATNTGVAYIHVCTTEVATSVFVSSDIYIPNYTSANQKSTSIDSVSEANAATGRDLIVAGLWTGTAAITGLTLLPIYGTLFNEHSSATLYGIKSS